MITAYVSKKPILDLDYFAKEFIEIHHLGSLEVFLQFFESIKHRGAALIYQIETKEDLERLQEVPFLNNIFIILIGPPDTDLVLKAGQIGVDEYISFDEVSEAKIAQMLQRGQNKLKKKRGYSNISVFTGIHGGCGTTTIALNSAVILAEKYLDSRILFIDLAYTKGIANLFFDNPSPKKNIISLFNEEYSDIQTLIDNGIYRFGYNLYYIPGIQMHSDKEELEKPENIQKMIHLITEAREYFDAIIVDVGLFQDFNLAIDIQEMADSLFAVSNLSIPSLSILSVYLRITERSGWRSKTNVIINRYDANGTLTLEEAKKLLKKSTKKEFKNFILFPNDWKNLNAAWNNIELAALVYKNSRFVKALEKMVEKEFVLRRQERKKGRISLKRLLSWA